MVFLPFCLLCFRPFFLRVSATLGYVCVCACLCRDVDGRRRQRKISILFLFTRKFHLCVCVCVFFVSFSFLLFKSNYHQSRIFSFDGFDIVGTVGGFGLWLRWRNINICFMYPLDSTRIHIQLNRYTYIKKMLLFRIVRKLLRCNTIGKSTRHRQKKT